MNLAILLLTLRLNGQVFVQPLEIATFFQCIVHKEDATAAFVRQHPGVEVLKGECTGRKVMRI